MRAVISGRIYDTETAEKICEHNSLPGTSTTDFSWFKSVLYHTPRGRFFLAGRGGPMTRWAEAQGGGGYSDGEGIRLIDRDEARSICERENMSPEDMSPFFVLEQG